MNQGECKTEQVKDSKDSIVQAYCDENVRASIAECDWFNTDYILEVVANEPDSEYSIEEGLKDKQVAGFIQAPEQANLVKGKSDLYHQLKNYVTERMVGSQGHPFPIGKIIRSKRKI